MKARSSYQVAMRRRIAWASGAGTAAGATIAGDRVDLGADEPTGPRSQADLRRRGREVAAPVRRREPDGIAGRLDEADRGDRLHAAPRAA